MTSASPTRAQLLVSAMVAVVVATGALVQTDADAVSPTAGPDFEIPFPCGQVWTGSTREKHSPSAYAVDFNFRTQDDGMPIVAALGGLVTKVVNGTTGYGRYLIIDHGAGYTTLYAHQKAIIVVVGQVVDQGQQIGFVGSTGGSTGPHLHFEERINGTYFPPYFHQKALVFGTAVTSQNCPDVPFTGEWDVEANGTDVGAFSTAAAPTALGRWSRVGIEDEDWGNGIGIPLAGDWDGDGVTDRGIREFNSNVFTTRTNAGVIRTRALGLASEQPVIGDWNGDRISDLGTFRPDTHTFTLFNANSTSTKLVFGVAGDLPITGDWNGDGRTEVGTYNPKTLTWTLRTVAGNGAVTSVRVPVFNKVGQLPVTGDWDNDKITDVGGWDPKTATFTFRTKPSGAASPSYRVLQWGTPRG